MSGLNGGQLQYLAGVLVAAVFGILLLFWTRLGLDPEFIFHGSKKGRITLASVCLLFALADMVVLLLNWNRVSSMGRIHFH